MNFSYSLHTKLAALHSAPKLLAKGHSVKIVARVLELSPSTLKRWLARLDACGGDIAAAAAPRPIGRPRKSIP